MGFEYVPKYVINVTKNWKVIVKGYISLTWWTSNLPPCYSEFIHRHLSRLFTAIFKLIIVWTVFLRKKVFLSRFHWVFLIYIFLNTLHYSPSKSKYFFEVNLHYCASSLIFKIKSFGVWMTYFSSKMYIYLSYDGRFFCNKYLLKRGLTHNSPQ